MTGKPRSMQGAIHRDIILGLVAAAAGLLAGQTLQPLIISSLPEIGWWTIASMLLIASLALPGTLVVLSMAERYGAMALSWTVFFVLGVFFLAASASALALAGSAAWTLPSSYLLVAWGLGILLSVTLLKWWLARIAANKAARAANQSTEDTEDIEDTEDTLNT
ncbi:hypothetical protein Thiowin_02176 [Thiorhodovibrio winogradskyi]|uniref:Uncharacterized protein n=1 Tax=Thiorhodovibrio winogradskyi TaxID=77007 RepID=A0ABZ0S856_9GAMM|nr:hypothetical protein [Thiorhodovibrio winogradskyi]